MRASVAALLVLLLTTVASAQDPILDSVFAQEDRRAALIADVEYTAALRYVERDLRVGRERELGCTRRVRMKRFERQHHEFLTASADGREVAGRARDRVVAELKLKAGVARATRMPFFAESRQEYSYRVLGRHAWRGIDCWAVGFEPKRRTDRHIRGFAYVSASTWELARLEFIPANLPFVVTDAGMALDYDLVQGFWLPVRFTMEMDLRLAILVEVMRMHISIEDRYTDYLLNPGFSDDVFQTEE